MIISREVAVQVPRMSAVRPVGLRPSTARATVRVSVRAFAWLVACVVAAAALLTPPAAAEVPAAPPAPALPGSMAAAGDSITRAHDVDWWHVFRDDPSRSWATGNDAGVDSVYSRLEAIDPQLTGHAFNDAASGARMAALDAQLQVAAGQHVGYVSVLVGADDLCTSTIGGMTPTADFSARFRHALADFTAADPTATVTVSSIPNLYQLWATLHGDVLARLTWQLFGVCPSMLSSSNTGAQRQQVVAREKADNGALGTVCAAFATCHFDGLATYRAAFGAGDVSTVDYFHPDTAGQALLAATAWGAGPWVGLG